MLISGIEKVKNMNISDPAGGFNKAVDIVFNDIQPKSGIIVDCQKMSFRDWQFCRYWKWGLVREEKVLSVTL